MRMKGGKQLKKSRIDSACGEAVLQCGFDYMSKIHKPKKKKKKKTGFWYLQTSDRLENPCKSHYV